MFFLISLIRPYGPSEGPLKEAFLTMNLTVKFWICFGFVYRWEWTAVGAWIGQAAAPVHLFSGSGSFVYLGAATLQSTRSNYPLRPRGPGSLHRRGRWYYRRGYAMLRHHRILFSPSKRYFYHVILPLISNVPVINHRFHDRCAVPNLLDVTVSNLSNI